MSWSLIIAFCTLAAIQSPPEEPCRAVTFQYADQVGCIEALEALSTTNSPSQVGIDLQLYKGGQVKAYCSGNEKVWPIPTE